MPGYAITHRGRKIACAGCTSTIYNRQQAFYTPHDRATYCLRSCAEGRRPFAAYLRTLTPAERGREYRALRG